MLCCRELQIIVGDCQTIMQTRSKTRIAVRERAVRFGFYLHQKKGMLKTSTDLKIWIGKFPPLYLSQLRRARTEFSPKHMWFCRLPSKDSSREIVGGPVLLCVCIHSPHLRCVECDFDDTESIKDNAIFGRMRSRCACILWNKPEHEWK